MAHFTFHENGGPFPGTCVRCGNNKQLWQLGKIPASNMAALLCDRCVQEIAVFTGFVTGSTYATQVAMSVEKTTKQQAQIDATPELLRRFSHDVSNLISDFVTSLAGIPIPDQPVQPASDQANTGSVEIKSGPAVKAGQGKKPNTKSGS